MGLKVDVEPGKSLIVGGTVIKVEYKKGGRTRLDIIAPNETRIVPNPTDLDVDAIVSATKCKRAGNNN